jgi:prolyl-tRNA editing enzyme YbaK/EbsC (Cys-tRNA(Pro) deacylase)
MDIELGTLHFKSATQYPHLLARPVVHALSKGVTDEIGVAEIDPNLSDTASFCEHYQIGMNQAANCVVLEAKKGDKTWFAACMVLGNMRADVNGIVRRTLDARKVSFAQMEQAVTITEMEYGAITPLGLPADWPILVDKAVADSEYVIIGSGIRGSKLAVPGSFFASLPNAMIIDGLAYPRI